MKIWLTVILFGIIPLQMHSQNITPDERQAYIDSLDSQDKIERYKALNEIHRLKIIEALPKIESVFWKADISFQVFSFLVFDALKSSNLYYFAKAYYDSADAIANRVTIFDSVLNIIDRSPYSALQLKAKLTYYLHKCGDNSTTSNVFEYLRNGGNNAMYEVQRTLKSIAKNVPEYADSAKYWLIKITKEPDIMASRIKAMRDLVELYGKEMYPVIVTMVTDTGDIGTRLMAYDLLYKTSYPDLHDLLKDRLLKETDPYLRYVIADSLLFHYGSITDYVFVKNYLPHETDPKMKSWIETDIRNYEPPKPDIVCTIAQILDSLASCFQQVAGYGWIGDAGFIAEINNYIVTAKDKILVKDSINCARQVWIFKQRINEEYVDSLDNDTKFVTIDGWKFLYYNAQYILDRLPQIPAESAADMLDTLSARLQMSSSNNWIGNQTFVQILEQSLNNAKSKYTAKDSIGCAQEIEIFYKLVRLRYIAPGNQFVKAEAYNLLYNYAREITVKVIVLPPKTNASLIDQITALKTQIRTDASGKLIGGELLLRGLESSLEIARQKLQKSDSTSAALYITLFQQTVRQTYEITKKYPSSRIYVKAGGYVSLYYRTEYILEHLTVPIGQPMPKMSKELEEELGKYQEVSR